MDVKRNVSHIERSRKRGVFNQNKKPTLRSLLQRPSFLAHELKKLSTGSNSEEKRMNPLNTEGLRDFVGLLSSTDKLIHPARENAHRT